MQLVESILARFKMDKTNEKKTRTIGKKYNSLRCYEKQRVSAFFALKAILKMWKGNEIQKKYGDAFGLGENSNYCSVCQLRFHTWETKKKRKMFKT